MRDITDKPAALRLLAECYRRTGDRQKANKYLREAIDILHKGHGRGREDVAIQLHNCLTNMGLLELDEAESLIDPSSFDVPAKFFRLLAGSKQHLNKARKITKSHLRNNSGNPDWTTFYCSDLLNLANTYLVEMQLFEEKKCSQKIVQLVSRVQTFYGLYCTEKGMRGILSKCYYNKGVAYRYLKEYGKAEKYLLTDNEYCRKHNLQHQLSKNKAQLVKLYVILNQYDKAYPFIEDTDTSKRKEIQQLSQNYRQVKKRASEFTFNKDAFEQYIILSEKLIEFDQYELLLSISRQIDCRNSQQQTDINYYICEALYKLNKLKDCQDYLIGCERQAKNKGKLKLMMLLANVKSQLEPQNREVVECLFKDCEVLARQLSDEQLQRRSKENYLIYLSEIAYRQMEDEEISEDEDILHSKMEIEEVQIVSKNEKKVKMTPPEQYICKCTQNNIRPISKVIEMLKNHNSFVGFANLSEKHLEIIFDAMTSLSTLDLRYNCCSDGIVLHIVQLIESAKLDVSQLGQAYFKGNCSNIYRLLELSPKVVELKLEGSQVKTDLLRNSTLKTLELKNCRISDRTLEKLLENQYFLQNLNLSKNVLTANCFGSLNVLKSLKKLNLSSNPLNDEEGLPLTSNLSGLKMKNIEFTDKLVDQILPLLEMPIVFDMSQCQNPLVFLKKIQYLYVSKHYKLGVRQLKLNYLPMDEETATYVKLVVMSCPNLRRLEMRNTQLDDLTSWLLQNYRHIDIQLD